ncbi:MAG: hypothetical protein FJZ01_06925 [Candidatus Sericytochromatia bacterium]|nr:hypothetical protein [Candidatus Tanganyikabacteria bacterium]
MAAEALGDALKLGLVVLLGAGYAAHKAGLLERLKLQDRERTVSFRRRPIFPPRRIRFDRAVLDVCGVDQVQLIRVTSRLRKMGFWIVGDFALPGAGSPLGAREKAFCRAFVHGDEPIYAVVTERRGPKTPPLYIDFVTLFVDQTFLTATNSDENDDPHRPGALRYHRLPGLLPEELYQHHWANLEALRGNWLKAVPASRDAFFAHYRQWLAVDYKLRRAKDADLRKDTLFRALEALPPLDIGPILRRYDRQRPPLEIGSRLGVERQVISEPSSPTVIREPERAPIRRRLPPSGPIAPEPAPPPAYGDPLASAQDAFQEVVYDVPPEVAQAHPWICWIGSRPNSSRRPRSCRARRPRASSRPVRRLPFLRRRKISRPGIPTSQPRSGNRRANPCRIPCPQRSSRSASIRSKCRWRRSWRTKLAIWPTCPSWSIPTRSRPASAGRCTSR